MSEILIFGGTTEGRELAEFCHLNRIPAAVCVTTQLGKELLSSFDTLKIITGKKDYGQIVNMLSKEKFSFVLDATHPFAENATENIKKACEDTHIKLFRIIRDSEKIDYDNIKYFDSIGDAAKYADKRPGNVLVTTGSKNLAEYTWMENFSDRIVVRVLPCSEIISSCIKMGFKKENIIGEVGPFTLEQNCSHIRRNNISIVITKESGKNGGFSEKIKAAQICGCEALVIRKPVEHGYSVEEIKKILRG